MKIICKICHNTFHKNNGAFAKHLQRDHKMQLEDYVILTDFNNIEPKCKCGCDKRPFFNRGKFSKYTKSHESYSHFKDQYIKQFGQPKCLNCGKLVKFDRRTVRKFCCGKCCGDYNKDAIIEKMAPKIKAKWMEKEYRELRIKQIHDARDRGCYDNHSKLMKKK